MADLVIRKQKCNSHAGGFKVVSLVEESNNCAASRQLRFMKH